METCSTYLLTIAIPTFNRAYFLDRTLSIILKQYNPAIELIVSDNCSIDNTTAVVNNYISAGLPIKYIKNEMNIGPDLNIGQCYYEAKGKYVLVFGDDDILLPGAIEKICKILRNDDFGLIFLNYYGFNDYNDSARQPLNLFKGTYLYKGVNILKIIRSRIGFTSANIVNKKFIDKESIIKDAGTNLNHMPIFLKAILGSDKNIYVSQYLLAQQDNNSGGFDYLEVIGRNYAIVVRTCLQKVDQISSDWILNELVIRAFPSSLLQNKRKRILNKETRNDFELLYDIYFKNKYFIIFCVPIEKLIKPFDYVFMYITKVVKILFLFYNKIPKEKKLIYE